MPSPYSREAQACRSTCGVSLVTGPRRRAAAAWFSAAAEGVAADRAAPLGGEHHRPRQLPVIVELAADPGHPPHQQRPGIAEHRHQPLPRPRAARALAHPHMDLAKRAVAEVQVLQPQPAQLPKPMPRLPGQPGHRVVPGGGQPLARRRQLAAQGGEKSRQRDRGGRHPDLEVAAVAGPVAVIDRGDDHPAGQLADLAPVAGLQEPEEHVDRLGPAPPGPHRLMPLGLAQEPVSVRRLDLPHRGARMLQELLHRADLPADRPVGYAVGQPGQRAPARPNDGRVTAGRLPLRLSGWRACSGRRGGRRRGSR